MVVNTAWAVFKSGGSWEAWFETTRAVLTTIPHTNPVLLLSHDISLHYTVILMDVTSVRLFQLTSLWRHNLNAVTVGKNDVKWQHFYHDGQGVIIFQYTKVILNHRFFVLNLYLMCWDCSARHQLLHLASFKLYINIHTSQRPLRRNIRLYDKICLCANMLYDNMSLWQ